MKEKLYKDDFKFIKLEKSSSSELVNINKIIDEILVLKARYNLYFYKDMFGMYDALSEIKTGLLLLDKLSADKNYDDYLKEITRLRGILWPLVEQKENIYNSLLLHFLKLNAKHENITALRYSFSLKGNDKFIASSITPNYITNTALSLSGILKNFLNRSRNRVVQNKICGYFWVWMRMPNGLPYLHVNFYVMERGFNAKLPNDIIQLWLECSREKGEGIYFSISHDFGNSEVHAGKIISIQSRSLTGHKNGAADIIACDYNSTIMSSIHSQYKFAADPSDATEFQKYLDVVSRENYALNLIPSIALPVQSGKKGKLQKIHSYGLSQIK
ncbi:hypothetical protein JHW33_13585 [Rahnella aceris]|uniref:hypothetical protein n=1 Tax=Rahnella sp. (strain Y9602) TaxID=2703885 RepID=UPI0019084DB6|nr:hypothetical protein [Rahnella aceris]QQN33499.1 hypothetical protein JHW33_13585 [Rahnella aceris]